MLEDDVARIDELIERIAELDEEGDGDEAADAAVDLADLVYEVEGPLPAVARYEDALRRIDAGEVGGWVDLRIYASYKLMWALSGAGCKSQAVQTAAELVRRHLEEADGDSLESIVDAGMMHAEALFEIGRADRALEMLERMRARMAEVDDSSMQAVAARLESEIADALRQLRRHDEALAALAAAAEALEPPADEEGVRALGWIASDTARVQGDLGRVDEAIATLAAFVERFADDDSDAVAERCADARKHMGYWKAVKSDRSLDRVGRVREAERLARAAVADGFYEAWVNLAYALDHARGDLDQQEHALRQALATDRDHGPSAAVRLGQLLAYGRGDRDGARAVLAEIADGTDQAAARLAAAALEDLETAPRRSRLKWRAMRWWRWLRSASPPARAVGMLRRRR